MLEDTSLHDRTGFRCGVPELDDYLPRFAAQQSARGVSAVYVLVHSDQPSRILGFYMGIPFAPTKALECRHPGRLTATKLVVRFDYLDNLEQ